LAEFELRTATDETPIADYDKWAPVKIASAIADVNPPQRLLGPEYPVKGGKDSRLTGPIEFALDGNADTAWTTDLDPGRRNQARYAIFTLAEPITVTPGMRLAFRLNQNHGGWNSDDNQTNNLGRFRIALTSAETLPAAAVPAAVWNALETAPSARNAGQRAALFEYWRTTVPDFREVNARIDGLWQGHPTGATQLVLQERTAPRQTHRLDRGDFLSPAEAVAPAVPSFLNPLKTQGAPGRLDFARWLVSPEAPTTARAYVNRLWQRHFGRGIVETSADFGMQGDPPTHPELLDWLAVEFMESGWDIKKIHRLIVTSATYRQASQVTPDLLDKDPYNTLLARGARFRVEGETVRDIALAASGLLNDTVGGPSVYPPAPAFLFEPPASYGPKVWNTETGREKYRRALYTFRFRSVPYPALQVFDTPAGDAPCTRRERSNSPLQALTTLNEPLFFESAIHLAGVALADGGATDRERMEFAFQRCATRTPDAAEIDTLLAFLAAQRARFTSGELAPESILGVGGKTQPSPNDPADLAAWTLTARVLLNLDETITRQ
ncbi:MAG: DUF1553 domain-containing protein, partial [Pedosphaera parvula]|nr:DUF1553 domain-containing protein [Pedosphaera parvula]